MQLQIVFTLKVFQVLTTIVSLEPMKNLINIKWLGEEQTHISGMVCIHE